MAENVYKNVEGYPDPTAFRALTNHGSKAGWKDGMIIKLSNWNDTESYRVVLKAHETYATTLLLFKGGKEGDYKVDVNGEPWFADLGKIGYTPGRTLNIADVVCILEDDVYLALLKNVAIQMGVQVAEGFDEQWGQLVRLNAQVEELTEIVEAQKVTIARLQENEQYYTKRMDEAKLVNVKSSSTQYSAIIAERDLYRQLYNELLGRIILKNTA